MARLRRIYAVSTFLGWEVDAVPALPFFVCGIDPLVVEHRWKVNLLLSFVDGPRVHVEARSTDEVSTLDNLHPLYRSDVVAEVVDYMRRKYMSLRGLYRSSIFDDDDLHILYRSALAVDGVGCALAKYISRQRLYGS